MIRAFSERIKRAVLTCLRRPATEARKKTWYYYYTHKCVQTSCRKRCNLLSRVVVDTNIPLRRIRRGILSNGSSCRLLSFRFRYWLVTQGLLVRMWVLRHFQEMSSWPAEIRSRGPQFVASPEIFQETKVESADETSCYWQISLVKLHSHNI